MRVELRSYRDLKMYDPVDKEMVPVFSRDLGLAIVKDANGHPLFALAGHHAKSKRDRPGDKESQILRTAQYVEIEKILKALEVELAKASGRQDFPINLNGDFNTDTRTGREVAPLRTFMRSAFDVAIRATPYRARITHSYHPHNGPTVYSQLDDFYVTSGFQRRILRAEVLEYIDPQGRVMALPRSHDERSEQPSDHRPVFMEVSP